MSQEHLSLCRGIIPHACMLIGLSELDATGCRKDEELE